MFENRWIPEQVKAGLTPKQAEFLCYEGREALYGGAAGGGKSVALLVAALQWIEEPGYTALILRRTYKQLAKSDSILNKAKEWLWGRTDAARRPARWNGEEKKWTFPNGNTLEFGHMEHEDAKLDYQGGSWPFIGVDEATQFNEPMLAYPRTRQRRPEGSRIPVRWRGGTNPGGIGHEYIKRRYVKDSTGKSPCGSNRQFFPARLEDNPHIDRAEYIETLRESGVDPLTLAQLLKGDWDAVPGGRFHRDWFREYDWQGDYLRLWPPGGRLQLLGQDLRIFKPHEARRFLTVDPAASTSRAADYTVVSAWCVSPWADLVWLGCDRFKAEIPDILPRVAKMVRRWKPAYVGIEAIASNRAVYQLASRCTDPVMAACPLEKAGADKLVHATTGIALAAAGRVYLPRAGVDPTFPIEDVVSELVRFTGNEKVDDHDDIVDTLSYAAELMGGMPTPGERRAAVPRVLGGG